MIITTAIPQITDEFNSAIDIGWYGSAYLLTSCAFQLVFGKIYSLFSVKATFLTTIFLFEVGSALCGAAPNSPTFILGRAIAGLGGAGIYSGGVSVLDTLTIILVCGEVSRWSSHIYRWLSSSSQFRSTNALSTKACLVPYLVLHR